MDLTLPPTPHVLSHLGNHSCGVLSLTFPLASSFCACTPAFPGSFSRSSPRFFEPPLPGNVCRQPWRVQGRKHPLLIPQGFLFGLFGQNPAVSSLQLDDLHQAGDREHGRPLAAEPSRALCVGSTLGPDPVGAHGASLGIPVSHWGEGQQVRVLGEPVDSLQYPKPTTVLQCCRRVGNPPLPL